MSKSLATKEKTREKSYEEMSTPSDELLCAQVAYEMLHDALHAVINCRDIVLVKGTQATIMAVCDQAELAMAAADLITPWPDQEEEMDGCVYCDVCETFWGVESETVGMCLSCREKGIS